MLMMLMLMGNDGELGAGKKHRQKKDLGWPPTESDKGAGRRRYDGEQDRERENTTRGTAAGSGGKVPGPVPGGILDRVDRR